jgi:hypothetical protein
MHCSAQSSYRWVRSSFQFVWPQLIPAKISSWHSDLLVFTQQFSLVALSVQPSLLSLVSVCITTAKISCWHSDLLVFTQQFSLVALSVQPSLLSLVSVCITTAKTFLLVLSVLLGLCLYFSISFDQFPASSIESAAAGRSCVRLGNLAGADLGTVFLSVDFSLVVRPATDLLRCAKFYSGATSLTSKLTLDRFFMRG